MVLKWLFGIGDTVETPEGKDVKVVKHKPEGFVLVRDPKTGKTSTEFGGKLKVKGGKK